MRLLRSRISKAPDLSHPLNKEVGWVCEFGDTLFWIPSPVIYKVISTHLGNLYTLETKDTRLPFNNIDNLLNFLHKKRESYIESGAEKSFAEFLMS